MLDCAGTAWQLEESVFKHLKPLSFVYMDSLKTLVKNKDLQGGAALHGESLKCGIFEESVPLQNTVISMYAKCGALLEARQVLDKLPLRDVVSWSALISGHAQNGQGMEALICYDDMRREGLSPDAVTYSSVLKACGLAREAKRGKQVHDEILSQGLLGKNVMLGGALVDMYANCGLLQTAQQVHDELLVRNIVSWNALISGYAQLGKAEEALACLECMQKDGFVPNTITYTCILKVCGIVKALNVGKRIHDEIARQGLLGKNVVLDTALLDMYGKCGTISKSLELFEMLSDRNAISWNALIASYAQGGQAKAALHCLQSMERDGINPNAVTYACIVKACSIARDVEMGEHIFEKIYRQGLLSGDFVLGIALVDMFSTFGMLKKAEMVLGKVHVRDVALWNALITGYAEQAQGVKASECLQCMENEGFIPNLVSWNALIGGYAQQGLSRKALHCFHLMQCKGTVPDAITFTCVLNACSHAGLVHEGEFLYFTMIDIYGITPFKEHYSCIIDLFGRARDFEMFIVLMNTIPTTDHPHVWAALLGVCQKSGNKRLGKLAFDHAVLLDDCDVAPYILMENTYVTAGIQEDGNLSDHMS